MYRFTTLSFLLLCFVSAYGHTGNPDSPPFSGLALAVDTGQHYSTDDSAELRMFVYMDPTLCHKCLLVNSGIWASFQELDDKSGHRFRFSYAITPPDPKYRIIVEYVKAMMLDKIVYLDLDRDFSRWAASSDAFEAGKPFMVLFDEFDRMLLAGDASEDSAMFENSVLFIQTYLNLCL